MNKHIGISELAEMLGVSSRTIRRQCALGRFPKPARIGKRIIFDMEKVAQFLTGQD